MASGYGECACCSEVIVLDDIKIPELCDDCTHAGCGVDCNDCSCYRETRKKKRHGAGTRTITDQILHRCCATHRFISARFVEAPQNSCPLFHNIHGGGMPGCNRPDWEEMR